MPTHAISPETFQTFGDLLKFLRRREQLTQLELSIKVGYSEGQISRLEQNQRLPDLTAIKALFLPALHLIYEPELSARLLQLAQSARLEDAPAPGIAPYKGLLFFDQADADLFFGREALTAHLVRRVTDLGLDGSPRFLAVVGASGSGKSSLIRAGLAVALQRAGWKILTITPTVNPLKILDVNINSASTKYGANNLLLVDQFEETFTLCRDENERIAFIEKLLSIARDPSPNTTVVIALRADFYSHCAQYPLLRAAVAAEQEYIGQMSQEELRRAIEEPARRGGWELERGLVDVLLSDIGADAMGQPEPGALPLLSHALLATWERRRGRTFTVAGYRESGGVRGAIAETAENVFTDRFNQQQQNLARDIFLRLTELGEGIEDTRRRATLKELAQKPEEDIQLRTVLNTLADARLIILNKESVEVAHEALIRKWQRLHDWLSQDREGLLLHRHLSETAHEWEKREHDAAELFRGARLAQTREWASTKQDRLNVAELAFIAASIEQERQGELEREAQRQREVEAFAEVQAANRVANSRELAGASFINLNIDPERSILLALQALTQADTFQAQAALHQAVQTSHLLKRVSAPVGSCYCAIAFSPDGSFLATESRDAMGQLTTQIRDAATLDVLFSKVGVWADDRWLDPDYLPIAAPSTDGSSTILTIWDATGQKPIATMKLPIYFDEWAPFIDISPCQTKVAAVSSTDLDNLSVFDMVTGQLMPHLGKPGYGYNGMIRFSPDSKSLLTLGGLIDYEYEATLWDVATGHELLTVPLQSTPSVIDFSPDGKRFAIDEDQNIRIVDIASGKDVQSLSGHIGFVQNGLQFNADGTRLISSAGDGTIRIWNVTTGRSLLTIFGNDTSNRTAALSPDSTRLATLSARGIQTWSITPIGISEWLAVPAASDRNCMIAYSPDGLQLAIFGDDQMVKILDSCSGQTNLTLPDPANQGRGLAFSPDGTRLATSGGDHRVHVWDLITGKELLTLVGPTAPVERVIFSPDGSWLATIDRGGEAHLWDATSGKELFTFSAFKSNTIQVTNNVDIAYSPDGSRLATVGSTSIIIWDTLTGREVLSLPPVKELLAYTVTFSPDGKHLAVGFRGTSANVWDVATGEKLFDLSGHTGSVRYLAYSPDGTRIATASVDGTTRLWDAATGAEQFALTSHNGQVTGLAFSPDGTRLATASRDGIVRVYALRLEDLIKIAKSRVTRSLTLEECQKYLHVAECPATP